MRADVGCMQMMTWKSFSTNNMNMMNLNMMFLNMIEVGGFRVNVIFILPTGLVDGCAGRDTKHLRNPLNGFLACGSR